MQLSRSSENSSLPGQEPYQLTTAEKSLLSIFRKFLVRPGEMLCFDGPTLDRHRRALSHLTEQGLLIKERFRGAYTLTPTGFAAMTDRQRNSA